MNDKQMAEKVMSDWLDEGWRGGGWQLLETETCPGNCSPMYGFGQPDENDMHLATVCAVSDGGKTAFFLHVGVVRNEDERLPTDEECGHVLAEFFPVSRGIESESGHPLRRSFVVEWRASEGNETVISV